MTPGSVGTPAGKLLGRTLAATGVPGRDFCFWAQFSRKLKVYEYSYLGPVLYMNIHITHDTKVFVTLREKKAMKYPFPVPSPNLNYNTEPFHHKQLRETMHTILPNVYRAYLV